MIEAHPTGNVVSQWGEGPIWWAGRLIYVDIESHLVVTLDPGRTEETTIDVGERVGTVVPRAGGKGLVIAGDSGMAFLDPETGEKTPIADPEPEKPDNRFNDGKCDPAGRFWAGTISLVKNEGDAALYMLDKEQHLHHKFGGVTNSNGIVWTADASSMFYIDTPRKQVLAFDFDNDRGDISNERIAVDTEKLGIAGSPDGMAIDASDNLWIAFCHGSSVICLDPKTGAILARIDLPVQEVTACAFGGDNLDVLYITTGLHKTEKERDAGRVFVAEPGVCGVPSVAYQG